MMKPILFNTEMVRAILDGRKTVTRRVVKLKYSNTHLTMRTDKYGTRLIEKQNEEPGVTIIKNPDGTTTHKLLACIEKTPPYRPGDILYVRETWNYGYIDTTDFEFQNNEDFFEELSPGTMQGTFLLPRYFYRTEDLYGVSGMKWRPSIHMPREAARIFLRVTDVRVERIQDITVDGILAEGVDVEIPPICKQTMDPNFPSDEQRAQWKTMTDTQREECAKNMARHTYIGWCDYADRLFGAFMRLCDSTIKKADRALYGWDANPWVWVIEFEKVSGEEENDEV